MPSHSLKVQEAFGLSAVSGIVPTLTWSGDVHEYLEWWHPRVSSFCKEGRLGVCRSGRYLRWVVVSWCCPIVSIKTVGYRP